MFIYRIEHGVTTLGMWHTLINDVDSPDGYPPEGGDVPLVSLLTRQDIAEMPMPDNDLWRAKGRQWYSGVPSMEAMGYWFTRGDMLELFELGFDIFRYDVTEWHHLETETLFTRESVISKINIKEEVLA